MLAHAVVCKHRTSDDNLGVARLHRRRTRTLGPSRACGARLGDTL